MNLKDLKISVLGDSITECAYLDKKYSFCDIISKQFNCEVRNYGIGGTCIAPSINLNKENPEYDLDFLQRFKSINKDTDILIVYGGTNDYGHGDMPFGTFEDKTPKSFLACLRVLCNKIQKEFPNCLVIFITPLKRENWIKTSSKFNKGELALSLENYANYIKYYSQIFGFECLDFFHDINIDPNNKKDKEKYTVDGLHPNIEGHKIIANKIIEFLLSYNKSDFSKNWNFLFNSKSDYQSFIKDKTGNYFKTSLPISFEQILINNKIEEDLYYSTNCWNFKKYEPYHQWYFKEFKKEDFDSIRFEGIDTLSEIYLNGELIGKTDNMFLPFKFKLKNLKDSNLIVVHILPSIIEGKKTKLPDYCFANKYNYESLSLRKSACSFGWDIFPRTPLGGIWKKVFLEKKQNPFDNFYLKTDYKKGNGIISLNFFNFKLDGKLNIEIFGHDFKKKISQHFQPKLKINVGKVLPWNLKGYGDSNLYNLVISYSNDRDHYVKNFRIGFRNVILKRSSIIENRGKFEFWINKEKVFLLGTNWVPTDALKHIDKERMYRTLNEIKDLGCNCIRVWGGGVYECEEFYNFCDENGIFIWQDFMMGCGIYPRYNAFKNNLKKEVKYIIQNNSYHPSICFFAGDNECDIACHWAEDKINPNTNILTRKLIPNIIKESKISTPYLPSSPYVDKIGFKHIEILSEDHLWGPRDYFRGSYYSDSKPYFVSETGYHGCPNLKSLKTFISKPWPIFDNKNHPTKEYLAHATSVEDDFKSPYAFRIKLMHNQTFVLFNQEFENLEDFILASQISQAEALKYFIEKVRSRKNSGGIIWWNIIDGWPQISDSIISYDFEKKLAFSYIKKSQEKILVFIIENKNDICEVYCSNLSNVTKTISYSIKDNDGDFVIKNDLIKVKPFTVSKVFSFKESKTKFFNIDYSFDNFKNQNHFVSKIKGVSFSKYVSFMKKINVL